MRPVRRREGVADEDIAELGQLLGKGWIVLLLAGVEAQVLQHGDVAVLQRACDLGGRFADAVGGEGDRPAEQLRELGRDGLQRILRIGSALGPAEMRDDNDAGAALGQVLEPGHDTLQACGVGDPAVLGRHVEVGAHQHALAPEV